jgi:hypothetical protein
MKKELFVTMMDGTIVKKDLKDFIADMTTTNRVPAAQRLPVNAPANHEIFKQLCAQVATTGLEKPDSDSATQCGWITPANIKSVDVFFSNQLTVN